MDLVQQFSASQMYKLLLPLALASDTLGLYSVIPDEVKMVTSIPLVSFLLLFMFVVEAGADVQMAVLFIAVFAGLYVYRKGALALTRPASEGYY